MKALKLNLPDESLVEIEYLSIKLKTSTEQIIIDAVNIYGWLKEQERNGNLLYISKDEGKTVKGLEIIYPNRG